VVLKVKSPGNLKMMFRSLQYRNYRLFFSGQGVSLIGTWVQRITMPWLVYHMTGSTLLLGVVSFAGQIPTFLLSPVAGVLTDRWNKYRVLVGTQVLSMVQAFFLAILSLTGVIQVWHIVILGIVLGCINAFDVPARQSFVIEMVGKKKDIGNAIALNSLMFNGARLLGPSLAGILLAATNEGICFLINAMSYLFVIVSLLMMKVNSGRQPKRDSRIWKDLNEGFIYSFGNLPIRQLLILLGVVSLTGMSYSVLMPVYSTDILHGDSHTYGFLMGATGFGALIGAIFLASRESVIKLGSIIPVAALTFGAGLISLSFSHSFLTSMFLMFFVGFGMMMQTAASNTVLQTITEDDKRGRVMSFYSMAVMGTVPFGSLMAGWLAKYIGTPGTIMAGGVVTMISALYFFTKLPEMKKIVHPVYVRLGVVPEVATGMQKASESDIQ
jgi:MFS family permease